jgi:hypothetical protein
VWVEWESDPIIKRKGWGIKNKSEKLLKAGRKKKREDTVRGNSKREQAFHHQCYINFEGDPAPAISNRRQ